MTKVEAKLIRHLERILKDEDRRHIRPLAHFLANERLTWHVKHLTGKDADDLDLVHADFDSEDKLVGMTDGRDVWINSDPTISLGRKRPTVIHEPLHIYNRRHKAGWSHSFIHSLAYNLVNLEPCGDTLCPRS